MTTTIRLDKNNKFEASYTTHLLGGNRVNGEFQRNSLKMSLTTIRLDKNNKFEASYTSHLLGGNRVNGEFQRNSLKMSL